MDDDDWDAPAAGGYTAPATATGGFDDDEDDWGASAPAVATSPVAKGGGDGIESRL